MQYPVAILFALATISAAPEGSLPEAPPGESRTAEHDLSLVSVKPVARDELNVFFEYTVRNNTAADVPPKEITIEAVFSKSPRFDPAETANTGGGKSSFGGVKPVPAGGDLSGTKHARLVDVSGSSRLAAGYRYLHVRVLHQVPWAETSGAPGDVGTIDLEALPADLPERPTDPAGSGSKEGTWNWPGWIWQSLGLVLAAGCVWLAKLVGRACWFWLPPGIAVAVGVPTGAALGAAVGSGFIWISPFGDNFWFFAPPAALFFGLVAGIQAGMTASGSRTTLNVTSGDD